MRKVKGKSGEKDVRLEQVGMGSGAGKSYLILIKYIHQEQVIQGMTFRKTLKIAVQLMFPAGLSPR